MQYRTKPFTINAVQWVDRGSLAEVEATFPDVQIEFDDGYDGEVIVRDELQGCWVNVNDGDYIIRGMKGEYYPCAAEVFEAKYEVDE